MTYKAYTTEFDRVVHARDLEDPTPFSGWANGDPHEESKLLPEAFASELAAGLEDGGPDGETVVLVDMGGSIRGSLKGIVAMVDGIALALEAKGAPFQVLGYTTVGWKGGESRKLWLAQERPGHPGRLCDLLHVVFKDRDETWASTRQHFRDTMRRGVMKENVDGEAVRWAVSRMDPGDGARLVHVGDGASVDDSTLAVNPSAFLRDDYEAAVREAEGRGVEVTLLETSAPPAREPLKGFRPARHVVIPYDDGTPAMAAAAIEAAFGRDPTPAP